MRKLKGGVASATSLARVLPLCDHIVPSLAVRADNGEDAVAAASGMASPGAAAGSQQASKGGTPQGSPRPAPSSPVKPGSPTSSDGCRCDATERRFVVKGDWLDLDKRVQLRLRICEPSGARCWRGERAAQLNSMAGGGCGSATHTQHLAQLTLLSSLSFAVQAPPAPWSLSLT